MEFFKIKLQLRSHGISIVILLAITLMLISCGGTSSANEETFQAGTITPGYAEKMSHNNINYNFFNAIEGIPLYFEENNSLINNQKAELTELISDVINQNLNSLNLLNIKVLIDSAEISLTSDWVVETNIAEGNALILSINTIPNSFSDTQQLNYMIARGLHQIVQLRTLSNPQENLLAAMIYYGAADHYARGISGVESTPWLSAIEEVDKSELITLALNDIELNQYDHDKWFKGDNIIPKWAGYTLGYDTVSRYLADFIGSDPANIASISATSFLPYLTQIEPDDIKTTVSVKTPDLTGNNYDQVPIAEITRQAILSPNNYFVEGYKFNKKIALTFDDGPSQYTQGILDVLAAYQIKATFFMMGQQVESMPEQAKAVQQAGHLIANHSWDHKDSSLYSDNNTFWQEQIEKTNTLFWNVFGLKSRLFRPPYGRINDNQIEFLADKGTKTILWSIDTRDWNPDINSEQFIINAVIQNEHTEAIVLMHDAGGNRENTTAALDDIIIHYQNLGYEFVTISELLGIGNNY